MLQQQVMETRTNDQPTLGDVFSRWIDEYSKPKNNETLLLVTKTRLNDVVRDAMNLFQSPRNTETQH